MTKVRIIVDGTVQGAGYRALVKYHASHRGIDGLVRNLYGRQVEIFCEGSKDRITRFIKDIDVKGRPDDPLSLNVEKLTVYWEGDEGFRDAWKAYEGFEIDYGTDKLTPYEKESLESLELAKLRFMRLEDGIYSPESSLDEASRILMYHYATLIYNKGRVAGIMTRADFLKLLRKDY